MEPRFDFNERPFIVIWETTQACDLACVHCRACAQPLRSSLELSTAEAKRLIDEVAALEAPVFVLTGGDPLKRPDVFELVEYDLKSRSPDIPYAKRHSAPDAGSHSKTERVWPGAAGHQSRWAKRRHSRRIPKSSWLLRLDTARSAVGAGDPAAGSDQHHDHPTQPAVSGFDDRAA